MLNKTGNDREPLLSLWHLLHAILQEAAKNCELCEKLFYKGQHVVMEVNIKNIEILNTSQNASSLLVYNSTF